MRRAALFALVSSLTVVSAGITVAALAQRAEARATYDADADATPTMAADERIHEEVVRALAARGRNQLSGTFRAAVFGANDGLVSNLALIIGVAAAGTPTAEAREAATERRDRGAIGQEVTA